MKRLLIAIIFVLSLGTVFSQGVVPDLTEKNALTDFYNAMNGANWVTPWTTAQIASFPATTLYGVTITNGDITSIDLPPNNRVRGVLPSSLGNLTALTTISIPGGSSYYASVRNEINGAIPATISNLVNLTSFNFLYHNFSGALPSQIGSLTLLTNLMLWDNPEMPNRMTGPIPTSWTNLINLAYLNLSNLDIGSATMPAGIQNWDLLQQLIMSNCNLTTNSFPSTFGGMAQLKLLELSANPLNTQPAPISDFPLLESLYLDQTGIKSLLSTFANLDNLKTLGLSQNAIVKADLTSLFTVLSGCAQLNSLNLGFNLITGLPSNFVSILPLQNLTLSANTSLDPTDLSALGLHPTLKSLTANSCNLTNLPSNLSSSTTLEILNVSYNQLNPVPSVVGSIVNLKQLYLQGNGITGTVNSAIGNLTNITYLFLSNNSIQALPTTFQNLTKLIYLDISYNQISGALPSYFSGYTFLQYLVCNNNLITSPLPNLSSATNLGYLRLNNNNFNEDLSSNLTTKSYIYEINIANNNFTSIPNFSTTPSRNSLRIYAENNKLNFGHIEPNFEGINNPVINDYGFTYSPQALVGLPITYYLIEGSNFILPFTMGGTRNKYKWQKYNGSAWVDLNAFSATSGFAITGVAPVHAGSYRVIIINDWATALTLTSQTITVALVTPLCTSSVPNLNGQFKMDKLTGAIVFERNDCSFTTALGCTVGPALAINKVVAANATTFKESWTFDHFNDPYASNVNLALLNANDFEKAKRGKWRVENTYAFNGALGAYDKNYNSGTFPYQAFNWKGSPPRQWLPVSKVELYSPHGEPLQESNALNIKSIAKFGYQNSVPYLTAKNTEYNWVLFESFEVGYGSPPTKWEDGLLKNNGNVSTAFFHSGKASLNLSGGGDLKMRSFDFKSIFNVRPMLVKLWIRLPDQTYYNQLSTDLSIRIFEDVNIPSVPMKVVARTGEWTLCEATLTNFGTLTAFTPIIKYNRSLSICIDDVRIQPQDAEMNAYVYDPATLRLLTIFDDQHFGLYYQYNAEGKLVRKMIETVKGLKVLEETQYNSPLVNK